VSGTISKLVRQGGYGFVLSSDQKLRLFFHASHVLGVGEYDKLTEGQAVAFDVEPGDGRGPIAVNVKAAA
jgi:cold shock CspA family protein